MELLDKVNAWVNANPAAPDWFQSEFPDYLKDELSEAYLKDPAAFKEAISHYEGWTYKEAKDHDDDTHGFVFILCTHHGEITAYANKDVFKSMAESVDTFTKLYATWYGRLWLKISFTLYRWTRGKE